MFGKDIKKGSMRQVTNEIFKLLRTDEELLRLLWYPSEDINKKQLHHMDMNLPCLVPTGLGEGVSGCVSSISEEEYWNIVDHVIIPGEKIQEIEENALCRIYMYPGRRRPVFGNYLMAKQELKIDVFVHEDYSKDYRMEWINDRINELLSLERIQGVLGMLDYVAGNPRVAPIGYSKYEHMFVFSGGKK